ncbi:unnamed protein product [Rhizophagus irregularis]|nr:unnamed protein product [Rhizophagus irregularis]
MSPSQTLSTKPVPSRKKDKTQITVLLGANATETDKLKPWVIRNAKRSRPLSKVNLERLPVFYHGNKKAWINSVVFKEVLYEMDSYFRAKNKKILLLVDNAPSHFNPNYSSAEQDEQNEKMKMILMMKKLKLLLQKVVVVDQEVDQEVVVDQEVAVVDQKVVVVDQVVDQVDINH